MANELQAMADRCVNGYNDFLECVMHAGLNEADARKAIATLLKVKAAKQDRQTGCIRVVHGAYMDRDVLLRAAAA